MLTHSHTTRKHNMLVYAQLVLFCLYRNLSLSFVQATNTIVCKTDEKSKQTTLFQPPQSKVFSFIVSKLLPTNQINGQMKLVEFISFVSRRRRRRYKLMVLFSLLILLFSKRDSNYCYCCVTQTHTHMPTNRPTFSALGFVMQHFKEPPKQRERSREID